jgi:hypothetical protein
MSRIVGSGGGGGGCFLGHTLVRVPDGQRRIDELQPSDLVLSFDDQGGIHPAKVLKVHVHAGERVNRYRLWGGAVLDATPNHWVLNQFNAFVEIGTLGPDDCLVDENGHLRPIVSSEELCVGTVYNLTVEGHHTFIAGGIRVHNAGLGLGPIAGAGGGKKKSKGGGGSTRTPTEAADNLNSAQYAQVLDLISEGEIEGLKEGDKSIFLDNTPLQNANGTYNFQNVTVYTRNGTQNQSYIPGSPGIEDERPVGVQVQQATPIVRTINDANVDAARITITVPQLQLFTDEGDINGTDVRLQIAVQYGGGGYTTVIDDTIAGRTADSYQRDYLVGLATTPADIRVTRVTPDSASAKLANAFNWTSYTEIVYAKLRYPNSALIGLRVDAEQFSSVPSRTYLIRGIKVQIPSNATVDQANGRLIYSGIWNGTFGAAQWCSDPAWVLWDLLTSKRYGFGDHIQAAQLDKWAFYAASQYAAELVPNGFGGFEPRFSCNTNIQTAEEAYKLINDMCSVLRVMPYWSTGTLTISQDRPADSAYLFTLANVSEEGFSYQGSSRKTRPTVAVVSYLDLPSADIAYEVVEDQAAIAKYGVVTTQISAFACTSRGQASRIGEWLLYSEQYESEVINFTASIDAGVVVRPGQIIEVADPMRAGSRRGGRIVTATTTAITVDDATGLPVSGGTLSVILPDGTVQERAVSGRSGAVITVSSAFTATPNVNSVWVYQTTDIQTSQWRVLSVAEQDGAQYAVSALAYNASKYAYIERGAALQPRDVTNLNVAPNAPANLRYEEVLYESNGRALSKIILSWQPIAGISQYRVRWRFGNNNWQEENISKPDYEILDNKQGTYQVQVYSVNPAFLRSTLPALLTVYAQAKSAAPINVAGINLVPIDEASAILSWDRAAELDVLLGGKVLIRHSVAMVGATWQNSQEIVAAAAGSQTQKQVPLLEGTYLLKFEDDTGNRSLVAATAVTDLPTPQPRLLVKTYAEDQEIPPFSGNVTGMFYSSELDGLIISTGDNVDDMAPDVVPGSPLIDENGDPILDENGDPILAEADSGDWDALPSIDSTGGVNLTGEYEFGSTWDMGTVFDVNMRRRFVTRPYLPAALWDDKVGLIDDWPEIDETNLDAANATLYVRFTNDNPGGSPVWDDWREFSNAIIRGRAFQFKVIASSGDPNQNIVIDELGAELELQQRIEQSATLTSSTTTYVATFAKPFYQAPAMGLTAFNMGTGDYFAISDVTRTGFQVVFRNSGGAAVSRQFTYTAIGYGKEII